MLNDCGTSVAALKLPSPACFAVIVHEPAPVKCTLFVLMVHWPLPVKLTANPDEAVALTGKSASPNVLLPKALNVIVWLLLMFVRLKVAGLAMPALPADTLYGPPAMLFAVALTVA